MVALRKKLDRTHEINDFGREAATEQRIDTLEEIAEILRTIWRRNGYNFLGECCTAIAQLAEMGIIASPAEIPDKIDRSTVTGRKFAVPAGNWRGLL
jgi:hypothetical protein